MPRIIIDQREIDVPPGTTLLAAAQTLGIDIPTLCYLKGYEPSTSCLVCMVRVRNANRLVPACATVAVDGMVIESETEEVRQVRKTALELLLSDHVGDCLAPCHFACPAHMDVPVMLRQITAEQLREAIVTVKASIALPAVLGRVCPKPCEKGCRRAAADGAVAVCGLKRFVADVDLASGNPYLPECSPPTGKRVAVVGAGPTGLSAAYYLRREGHAVTLFDARPEAGGACGMRPRRRASTRGPRRGNRHDCRAGHRAAAEHYRGRWGTSRKGDSPQDNSGQSPGNAPVSAGGQSPFRDVPGRFCGNQRGRCLEPGGGDAGRSPPAVRRGATRLRKRCQGSCGGLGSETGRPRHPGRKRDVCHEPAGRICRGQCDPAPRG